MTPSLRRAALVALALTLGLGTVSNLLFAAAFQFRIDWALDPARLVAGGTTSAELLRWGAITDLLSYYLPTAVVAFVLRVALRPRGAALADLGTLSVLGYVVAGSIGAVSLGFAGPMLMEAYALPGADQPTIALAFRALTEIVFLAIWQFLDAIFAGVWLLAVAVLIRADQPGFSRLSLAVGVIFLLAALLNALGLGLGTDAGLGVLAGAAVAYTALTAWLIWLAVLLWRRRPPFQEVEVPA